MSVRILIGDVRQRLSELPDGAVHCCVTSPPYFGLRDYGMPGQIGLEETPEAYVAEMVGVFREVRRVLRDDGTLWLNLGDSYARSAAKGQHKPGDSGKQDYIIRNGGGRAAGGMINLKSETRGSSDGRVGRGDRAPVRNGDAALKEKDLIGIPWRVAFALQADGWFLRQDIIWSKPNPMPESVTDRCTKSHEYVFLLSKSARYFYDAEAVAEPSVGEPPISRMKIHDGLKAAQLQSLSTTTLGTPADMTRNRRSVWPIATQPYSEAHFATFPPELPEICIKAGCPVGGTVLDPFGGAGTTALVADRLGRDAIIVELNPKYAAMAHERIEGDSGMFAAITSETAA